MSLHMTVALGLLLGLTMAAQTDAGTFFRLEIGPAVAAGTDSKVKKAVLVVRPRVCDDEASVRITGTAEGILNGTRQSVPLTLVALKTPGAHAVQREWPLGGDWVLHLTGTCPATHAVASTIVPIGPSGFVREKTQVLRQLASRAQIDAALADLTRTGS